MKTSRIVLVALALAVPVILNAQDKGNASAQAKGKGTESSRLSPLERAKKYSGIKGSRKIGLKPVKQSDGIETGCVMAYGHIIPPPYSVEYVGNKLTINGIQILPSLVAQRESKPFKATDEKRALVKKASELERAIRLMFWKELDDKKNDIESIQSNILTFAKSNEMVLDAKWSGTLLDIRYKDKWLSGVLIELNKDIPRQYGKSPVPDSDRTKKVQTDRASQIKTALSRGAFYVLVDGLLETHADIIPDVNKIMRDATLTETNRFEQLTTIFHPNAVLYVMENYLPSEWENSGCIINPDYPQEWDKKAEKSK